MTNILEVFLSLKKKMCLSHVKNCPILNEHMPKWTAVTSSDIYCFEEKQEKSQCVAHGDAVLQFCRCFIVEVLFCQVLTLAEAVE